MANQLVLSPEKRLLLFSCWINRRIIGLLRSFPEASLKGRAVPWKPDGVLVRFFQGTFSVQPCVPYMTIAFRESMPQDTLRRQAIIIGIPIHHGDSIPYVDKYIGGIQVYDNTNGDDCTQFRRIPWWVETWTIAWACLVIFRQRVY